MMRAALVAACLSLAASAAASDPVLSLPIDCDLGRSCHIQQYPDHDPGPGARDFRCGPLSYDGHKGTDIAVPTLAEMRRGVDVLAAAPGEVAALRDGMPDTGMTEQTRDQISGRECGNGVVLRHGDGWETQYCHMKSGSIRVKKGQAVERGTVLGQVGLSGRSQFPHVHLSVRHNGAVVDPFDPADIGSCGSTGPGLWQNSPPYVPGGLIYAGFAPGVPDYDAVKAGTAARDSLERDAPALVLFAYAFGGQQDDVIEIVINGPAGPVITHSDGLTKGQAQLFRAAGKRQPPNGWPTGAYVGIVRMLRDGQEIDRARVELRIE